MSDAARSWLARQSAQALIASGWVLTEFASAMAMKARRGVLDPQNRAAVERRWQTMLDESFTIERVENAHFARAEVLVDHLPNGLRAGDALHLAIVLDCGYALVTLDDDLAAAARAAGVEVHVIREP